MVERRGPDHPDTLCDRAAEEVCRVLCRLYVTRLRGILHYNVDKCALAYAPASASWTGCSKRRRTAGELNSPFGLASEWDAARACWTAGVADGPPVLDLESC